MCICFREILPDKHVEYFNPWVYSFGYELIMHSTRLPLISGFYKLLSVAMKIAKKIKYFEVRSFPIGGVTCFINDGGVLLYKPFIHVCAMLKVHCNC